MSSSAPRRTQTHVLAVARAEGQLGAIEDDLFRFSRTLEGNDALRTALTDPSLPATRRIAVVEELMGGKALAGEHVAASWRSSGAGRASELAEIVGRVPGEGGVRAWARGRRGAVRDPARRRAAAAARRRARREATRKQVEVKVVVDATVLGGLVTRIGDTVIDGIDPSPARATEGNDLTHVNYELRSEPSTQREERSMAELTINADEIAAALRTHVESRSRRRWRRSRSVASSRSATASPASPACPTPSVNELLEFEGGAARPRPEPRRGDRSARSSSARPTRSRRARRVKATGRILSVPGRRRAASAGW